MPRPKAGLRFHQPWLPARAPHTDELPGPSRSIETGSATRSAKEAIVPVCEVPTNASPHWEIESNPLMQVSPRYLIPPMMGLHFQHEFHRHLKVHPGDLAKRSRYFAGGGTGNLSSVVLTHLSPSSINITGISSTIGYLRPQSLQMNQASLYSFSAPPVVRTQLGQRKISIKVSLTIDSPFSKREILPC